MWIPRPCQEIFIRKVCREKHFKQNLLDEIMRLNNLLRAVKIYSKLLCNDGREFELIKERKIISFSQTNKDYH